MAEDMLVEGHPLADVIAMVGKYEEHYAADHDQRSSDSAVHSFVPNVGELLRLLTKDVFAPGSGPKPEMYNPPMVDVLKQAARIMYERGVSGEYFTCLMTPCRTPATFRKTVLRHSDKSFLDRMFRITGRPVDEAGEWFIASAGNMSTVELGDEYRRFFGDEAPEATIFRVSWRALLATHGRHLAADSILVCTTSCPLLRSTSDGFSETDSASYRRSVAWLVVAFRVFVRGWVEVDGQWHYVCCSVICFALLVQEWVAHPMIGECQLGRAAPVSASLTVGCGLAGTPRTQEQPTEEEIHPVFRSHREVTAGGAGGGGMGGEGAVSVRTAGGTGSKRARTGEGGESVGEGSVSMAVGMDVT